MNKCINDVLKAEMMLGVHEVFPSKYVKTLVSLSLVPLPLKYTPRCYYNVSSYTATFSCPPTLQKIFMLSSTCFFKSARVTFCPSKAPKVVSNSNGLSAFQIAWIFGGGSGITVEVSYCLSLM
jgi:hypothetical protein